MSPYVDTRELTQESGGPPGPGTFPWPKAWTVAGGVEMTVCGGWARTSALAGCVLALPFLWAASAAAQESPADGTIRGRVVDEITGTGLPGAQVEFLDSSRRVLGRTVADDGGLFVLSRLPPGPFRLRVTQLGFLQTTTPVWWVQVGDVLDVVVWLSPDAIPLAPLEVVALTQRRLPVLSGFYRRREDAVGGYFLDREEIEQRHASRITDLLVDLPGVRLENAPGYPGQARAVTLGRALLAAGGGRCPVQVFVDGILASRGGGAVPLDDLASPASLEGIEIYRGLSSVPAEFLTPEARCGVVVLWTKRGGETR